MEYSKINIEILTVKQKDTKAMLHTIREMHNRGSDELMGAVSCVNMYTGSIRKAPVYGVPPRGLIFKMFNN